MRAEKRSTASGSSGADWTASASSERAPTGVFSSWDTLATKSRRTASTRWASDRSSIMTSEAVDDNGATRTRACIATRPRGGRRSSSSSSRMAPSRRTCVTSATISGMSTRAPWLIPRFAASGDARSTVLSDPTTNAAPGRTARTRRIPSGTFGDGTPAGSAEPVVGCACDSADERRPNKRSTNTPRTVPPRAPATNATVGSTTSPYRVGDRANAEIAQKSGILDPEPL